LNALRKFISRRGWPKKIITDNAPSFILVKQTVNKVARMSEEISGFFATNEIE